MACKFHAFMTPPIRHRLPARPAPLLRASAGFALAFTLALLPVAHAERADRLQRINVDADSAKADVQGQSVEYSGNVTISRGTLVIRAARIVMRELPSGYYTAVAYGGSGKPATFRQKRDSADEYFEGEAERLEYDGRSNLIKFINQARMRQLRGATLASDTTGDLIVYDATTEKITVSGDSAKPTAANPGGRIRMELIPREGSEAAAEISAAASAPLRLSPTLGASSPAAKDKP